MTANARLASTLVVTAVLPVDSGDEGPMGSSGRFTKQEP
jgi:hypothetical protein